MVEDIVRIQDFTTASTVEIKHGNNTDTISKKAENTDNAEDVKAHDNKSVEEAIATISNAARFFNRKIRLEFSGELNIMIVKVIDEKTGQVIRQIPPEELVKLSQHAKDLKGLLIHKEG